MLAAAPRQVAKDATRKARQKTRKTTVGDSAETERPEELVQRKFFATGPDQLYG